MINAIGAEKPHDKGSFALIESTFWCYFVLFSFSNIFLIINLLSNHHTGYCHEFSKQAVYRSDINVEFCT